MHDPDRRIAVDKQSIDYQLGAIITRIDGQNGQLKELTNTIGELTNTVRLLPCTSHSERLKTLEAKRISKKKMEQWQVQNKITFKQGLVFAIVTAIIATGTTIGVTLLL